MRPELLCSCAALLLPPQRPAPGRLAVGLSEARAPPTPRLPSAACSLPLCCSPAPSATSKERVSSRRAQHPGACEGHVVFSPWPLLLIVGLFPGSLESVSLWP